MAYLPRKAPRAAYIGASNGDQREFYELFLAAFDQIGVTDCRRILSTFSDADQAFLEQADLILLSGGDVVRGWRVFEAAGVDETIPNLYRAGALLVGISAGAIQLGTGWLGRGSDEPNGPIDMFQLAPFVLGVHEEQEDWSRLIRTMKSMGGDRTGFGIPRGGGLILHPDRSFGGRSAPSPQVRVEGRADTFASSSGPLRSTEIACA